MKKYKLLVTWNIYYFTDSPSRNHGENVEEIMEMPKWLKIDKEDVNDDDYYENYIDFDRFEHEYGEDND